jgi:hypothetical protein
MKEKKKRRATQRKPVLDLLMDSPKKSNNYIGYLPTTVREPPKMFINPADDDLREMIRKVFLDEMPKPVKKKAKK